MQEQENKKAYTSLLQNQLLDIQNENLLEEIHSSDENQFQEDMYTQMQRKADKSREAVNTPGSPADIYNGAFAFTSPPERVMLSDTTNQQEVSPFSSRFTVLKFNSESKNNKNKVAKSNGSKSAGKNFNFKKPTKLIDLQVNDQILGKGIFAQA